MIGIFGHHKCASMWVHGICGQVALDLGLRIETVFTEREFDGDLGRHMERRPADILLYGNADFEQVRRLPLDRLRGFHYVRDPRDIVVSAYFSHRNSHSTEAWPELIAYRERLQSCSKEEGIALEIDFREEQFREMRSWAQYDASQGITNYRIEDLTSNPYRMVLEAFRALDLVDDEYYTPSKRIGFVLAKACRRIELKTGSKIRLPFSIDRLPAERMLGIVYEREFSKLTGGRRKGQTDAKSHYRKGVHGDWLNHFTIEHLNAFKERYGDVVLQYGYESDPDWDLKYRPMIIERSAAAAAVE